MSKTLSTIAAHSSYQAPPNQKLTPISVGVCTPITAEQGPVTVPVVIPWADYGVGNSKRNCAIDIDLRSLQIARFDAVRSIKIDNSFNDVAIYVQATDTLDAVLCPANAVVTSPILTAKNNQLFSVYGQGFFTGRSPQTTIQFSNVPVAGFDLQPGARYEALGALTDRRYSNANANSYTFNTADLGPALPDRVLVAIVCTHKDIGVVDYTPTLTIGGVAMTAIAAAKSAVVLAGSGTLAVVQMFYLPTRGTALENLTTGAAVVTMPVGFQSRYCGLLVYSLSNLENNAPFSASADSLGLQGSMTVTLDGIPGDYRIWGGFARDIRTAEDYPPIYNAIKDSDSYDKSDDVYMTSAHLFGETAGAWSASMSIGPTNEQGLWVGANWR